MPNHHRLPITIRYASDESLRIQFGSDERAYFYLYFLPDENRDVAPGRLKRTEAAELAKDIARILTAAWYV